LNPNDENNVTGETVPVTVDGVTANIHEDYLREVVKEAYTHLSEAQLHMDNFKDLVESVKLKTGLKKGFVSKYLKARYKQKTKAEKETGKGFAVLDDILGDDE
jgi:hypothetical protein